MRVQAGIFFQIKLPIELRRTAKFGFGKGVTPTLLKALVVCLVAVLRAMASMRRGDLEDAQRSERLSCSPLVDANSNSKPLPRRPPASARS